MDLITHNDVVIRASTARIWRYVLDTSTWKRGAALVSVAGERGKVGERFNAVMPGEPGNVLFTVENVEIAARRRRTIRLNSPGGMLIGFAIWRLSPRGQATAVEYDVYSTLDSGTGSAGDSRRRMAAERAAHKANHARFAKELLALKKLVESQKRPSAASRR